MTFVTVTIDVMYVVHDVADVDYLRKVLLPNVFHAADAADAAM